MKTKKMLLVLAAGALVGTGLAAVARNPLQAKAGSVTYLEKTFSTDGIADAAASANIAVVTDQEFNGVRPVDGGQVAYITYEINTKDPAAEFTELTLSVDTGRFAYYFGDFGNYFDMYVSSDAAALGTQVVHELGTGDAKTQFSHTVSSGLGGSTLYVSFGFSPKNSGCGWDTGWTIFDHFVVTGEEVASSTDTHVHTLSDNWRGGSEGSYPGHSTATTQNIGGDGNTTHGAIVGTWGGTLSVEEGATGIVEYYVGTEGEIVTDATFTFTAKFNNMGNNEMHWGDMIKVRGSYDGLNYLDLKTYRHSEGDGITTVNSDEYTDSVTINGLKETGIYLRLELTHQLALSNIDLNMWGMKLFSTSVRYQTKDGFFINYDVDGGTLPEGTLSAFFAEDAVYTLPTPTRDGYDFLGWYSGEDAVTTFDPSQGENLNVKAHWALQSNSHTIVYHGAEGVDNPNPETYSSTDEDITLVDLVKTGYTFLGFYDAETGGNKVETIDTALDQDIELWARFEEKTYAIDYLVSEHILLSEQPTEIGYTEIKTITLTPDEGYGIATVILDGDTLNPDEPVTIRGDLDRAHMLSVTAYALQHVSTEVNENFSALANNDRAFAAEAYEYSNLVIIHNGEDGAGLCKMSAGDAYITYKFEAEEGKAFNGIHLTGLARLFDLNGANVNFTVYLSTDNENFVAFKEYVPLNAQDGAEKVDLAYEDEIDETETLYVKVVWNCESAGMDWVVLKKLGIRLDSVETGGDEPIEPPTSEPGSSETPVTPSTPEKSEEKGSETKKGCGGAILSAGIASAIALAGVVAIASKKRKD